MLFETLPGLRFRLLNRLKKSARISSFALSPITRVFGKPNALVIEASTSLYPGPLNELRRNALEVEEVQQQPAGKHPSLLAWKFGTLKILVRIRNHRVRVCHSTVAVV